MRLLDTETSGGAAATSSNFPRDPESGPEPRAPSPETR
jgi:hypothetical protein